MSDDILHDVRATPAAERLLEQSWVARSRRAPRRELVSEAAAAVAFLAVAAPLATVAVSGSHAGVARCLLLIVVYALAARVVRFPVGTGFANPAYLGLVPMLLLAPPQLAGLLVCAGLVLGSLVRVLSRRARPHEILLSIPDAFYALGPAAVLTLTGHAHGLRLAGVYVVAFLAGCLVDLAASIAREWLVSGIPPGLQLRVMLHTWTLDACFAPIGLGIALLAREHLGAIALLAPIGVLVLLADRDRTARIARAHERLGLLAHERERLQSAVQHLGEAFAAKLDLTALAGVLLRSCVDALDATAGLVMLGDDAPRTTGPGEAEDVLVRAATAARLTGTPGKVCDERGWGFAVAVSVPEVRPGALAVMRTDRPFTEDEQRLMTGLADRAAAAAAEIVGHEQLHVQTVTDSLTRLGNRRALVERMEGELASLTSDAPLLLTIFDLDGFKAFNDTHGHLAGDELLTRVGRRLASCAATDGAAYRLGGDEFCLLLPDGAGADERLWTAARALDETDGPVTVTASYGTVRLPAEADELTDALALADRRMYESKRRRGGAPSQRVRDVLVDVLRAQGADAVDASSLDAFARRVAARMDPVLLDALPRAAAPPDVVTPSDATGPRDVVASLDVIAPPDLIAPPDVVALRG